ncbi:WGR domain-containing protein [Candidatus Albibeggiatoa sp. nov. NOAA]|uniref:WGR domain-containing protein n=1 Tax=Candidatus Albibeggiatoa sp. nov. NOAA TaxID=3162724 RepID=UPI0032FAF8A0|nr:WGR domain-containing protein [Thiotrichaceae bacterium]
MATEKFYLELSEEQGVAHKFYEVTIDGCELTIRYGRIGTTGRVDSKTFPSEEAARKEANKKLKQKRSKGYEEAVMGIRQKRPITRRSTESRRSTAKRSPLLWRFKSGASAFGIFINADRCWVGNQDGSVFVLNHNAEVINQYRLPNGVKCIIADDIWLYAGCDDGCVYDLSGKLPRVAYEVAENIDILWMDIYNAQLGISDGNGTVLVADHENEALWQKSSSGNTGWMIRNDADGVYHGHSRGVTAYSNTDHATKWDYKTRGAVLFGWQEKTMVYAGASDNKVYALHKSDGELAQIYACDAAVYSCATAESGQYVFAGDSCSSVYCFNQNGERLWKLATGCGSALSMQYFQNKLYIVTTDGSLACIDVSESAIEAAKAGEVPESKAIKAPAPVAVTTSTELETVEKPTEGVLLKCVKEGGKLRIKAISSVVNCTQENGELRIDITPEYHANWNVQFPRNLREEGAIYIVDEIREASSGHFYRVYGNIRRLSQ